MDKNYRELNEKHAHRASEVCKFLAELSKKYPEEWAAVKGDLPYGDLAYGMALDMWIQDGKDPKAIFSYDRDTVPCPFMMRFRTELSEHFGLPILTPDEADMYKASNTNIVFAQQDVHDWGLD